VAQSWRSKAARPGPGGPPALDGPALQRLALRYAERYLTTEARLAAYLDRKLTERGWADGTPPDVAGLVAELARLGYVDDAAFAAARARALVRRGYGPRRIGQSLRAAGTRDDETAAALALAPGEAWAAALAFARRRRIGPFAAARPDAAGREKAYAALIRAGHSSAHARRLLAADPGCVPEEDEA
jgi:regulatory protein